MPRKRLTDRTIKALRPAEDGRRYDVMDELVTGFGVRVYDGGKKTFVLVARYPGSSNPTRSALGIYGNISLEAAREKARDWLEKLRSGVDPRSDERRIRVEAEASSSHTFDALAEEFIAKAVVGPNPDKPRQRKSDAVSHMLRSTLVPIWRGRPIGEVARAEIRSVIEDVRDHGTAKMLAKRGIKQKAAGRGARRREGPAPAHARNLLGLLKQFFSWAVDRIDNEKILAASPCAMLSARRIIGEKASGARVLSDDELFAFWRAVDRLPYPYKPAYRLLAFTALRLNEAVRASWPEFDIPRQLWVIPSERMKGKNGKARAHAVPLTPAIIKILGDLPQFSSGQFLFSTTNGKKPIRLGDKIKKRIDARMLRTLRALARARGNDPNAIEFMHWTNHDIRRTVRSHLSRLKVSEEAREAVLAHARPGIKGTYDLHDYFEEKREALEQWSGRLRGIVEIRPLVKAGTKSRPFSGQLPRDR